MATKQLANETANVKRGQLLKISTAKCSCVYDEKSYTYLVLELLGEQGRTALH